MGSFTNAGALANILEAARRVGIDKDRIQDILTTAPAASGVAWNDGGVGTNVNSVIREAFRQRGLYQDKADQFIAAITALDTGIQATITVPDLEDLRWTAAIQALVDAGFVGGTISVYDTDGTWTIGTVTETQDPVAAVTETDLADNVVDFTVQGVPDVNDATLAAAVTELESAGLVIAGLGDPIACTVAVATDVITKTAHGLLDGDRVLLSALATAGGFTVGDILYVHSKAANTFELETEIGADDGDFTGSNGTLSVRKIDPDLISYVDPDGAAADDAIATDPVAGTYLGLDDGDTIELTLGGVAVPAWSAGGTGDGDALTDTEFEAALAAAGLVGDGTAGEAGTLGAVTASVPDEGEFVALGSVVAYDYTTAA